VVEELRGMDVVRVDRTQILEKLRANLNEHEAVYAEAMKGWHAECIAVVEKQIEVMNEAVAKAKAGEDISTQVGWFTFPSKPQLHAKDYRRAIALLEISLDDQIELGAEEVTQFVMDEWEWKQQFTTTSNSYLAADSAHRHG
jgi:hypothetical protein